MKKTATVILTVLLAVCLCFSVLAADRGTYSALLCSDKTDGISDGDPGLDDVSDPMAEPALSDDVGVKLPDSSSAVPNFGGYDFKTVAYKINIPIAVIGGATLLCGIVFFVLFLLKKRKPFALLAACLCAAGIALSAVSILLSPQRTAFKSSKTVESALAAVEQKPEYPAAATFEPGENSFPEDRSAKLLRPENGNGRTVVADMNVTDFGASGDGKTDSTLAFIDAVAQISKKGGTVFVPAGKYVLSDSIKLPTGVALEGETDKDGKPASFLLIYGGKGDEEAQSAVVMDFQSALKNIAFYYPEQQFFHGAPIPYPYTVTQNGSEGILLENVNFINSYKAVDLSSGENNSLQTLRNISGTPLKTGIALDGSLDIGRFEGINFSYKYWLESGEQNLPDKKVLRTWLLRNAVGFEAGMVDWTYFSDFNIEGYNIGIRFEPTEKGSANGHLYGSKFTDCYYALYINNNKWLNFTNCEFTAYGNEGAAAIYIDKTSVTALTLADCKVESCGKYAILNEGQSTLVAERCGISSNGDAPYLTYTDKYSFVDTSFSSGGDKYKLLSNASQLPDTQVDCSRRTDLYPKSDAFVNLNDTVAQRTDISNALQNAVDSLKETGGTVYIPGGYYYMTAPVTVYEGIEIRGCEDIPNYFPKTMIYTDYGRDNENGQALFTLKSNAGLRGIGIHYYLQSTDDIRPFAFTARGAGSDVYIINTAFINSYNGVDFASEKCDRHYVEYIWGTPVYRGIVVGAGSADGVIRDVHYTPNAWYTAKDRLEQKAHSDFDTRLEYVKANSQPFVIGASENELLFHNFVYGAYRGLTVLDGAKNATAISHGVDCGNISVYAEGSGEIKLIDPQLVNLPGNDLNYILTGHDFSGKISAVNLACWGRPKFSFRIFGSGRVELFGGYVNNAGATLFDCFGGDIYVSGIFNDFGHNNYDFNVEKTVDKVMAVGNIYRAEPKYRVTASGKFEIIE